MGMHQPFAYDLVTRIFMTEKNEHLRLYRCVNIFQ